MEKLLEKDELILELKAALLARETLIGQLELNISMIQELKSSQSLPGASSAPQHQPEFAEGAISLPLVAMRAETKACLRLLDIDKSTGIFADGWLAPEAELVFDSAYAGHEINLIFYLPRGENSESKPIDVLPNFADPRTFTIERGKPRSETFRVPDDMRALPRIAIDAQVPEATMTQDSRSLGIFLIDVGVERLSD